MIGYKRCFINTCLIILYCDLYLQYNVDFSYTCKLCRVNKANRALFWIFLFEIKLAFCDLRSTMCWYHVDFLRWEPFRGLKSKDHYLLRCSHRVFFIALNDHHKQITKMLKDPSSLKNRLQMYLDSVML